MSKVARQPSYIPEDRPSADMPFLTLSVFILLLAFFVILNTNSEFEIRKASPVLESLEKQFAKKFWGPANYSTESSDNTPNLGEGSAQEILDGLFSSTSISFDIKKIDDSGNFIISLKKLDFEKAVQQVISGLLIQGVANKGKVFESYLKIFTQISIMTSPSNKKDGYTMSVFIYKTDIDKNSKELVSYKKQLLEIGINENNLAFGMKDMDKNKSDMVELYFTR